MGAVTYIRDRLMNVMSGMGTTADKRTAAFYAFNPITLEQAEAAYRTSWLVRKIVDVPPFDMTREWRDWQADGSDIEAIEAEEKRLQLSAKCQRALILARLYGGGALILGTADQDQTQPLNPESLRKGGLLYVHVMSRQQLGEGQPRTDPTDPWFGQPDHFTINGSNGSQVRLHPSRVVAFIGQRAPEGAFYQSASWFWGDPIMQSIGEAVKNADTAQAGFASLIDEAKIDIMKVKDLSSLMATDEGERRLTTRLTATSTAKSVFRTLMLDSEDEWEQRQVTWAGIPDIMSAFLNVVAGAADIPVTRLLGQSPKGLQSTGDGEERDYHSMVKARQAELLGPALDRIDELLIRSALGAKPDDVYYEFAPLDALSEKDAATVELNLSTTIKNYADTGLIPDVALSAMAKNRIIESGRWPGSEAAFGEAEANPEPEQDPNDLTTLEARIAQMEQRGTINQADAIGLVTDAAPRSLYVSRKLLNADALVKWAKAQGIESPVSADQMHVTVLYSRTPVDWMAMGSTWDQDQDGKLRVPPGGPRVVDLFGAEKDTLVLQFSSSGLSWRHEEMVRKGASHDYDEYAPHVSIAFDVAPDFDLSAIEPYQGELIFGPEVFREIDDDWKAKAAAA
jgi:phage-related protein (TIGR01555 family)